MVLTQKSVFKNAFLDIILIISYHFLKPLIGFIALLTLSKVKFKSFIYWNFVNTAVFFKKCIKGVKAFLKECERLEGLQGAR